MRLAHLPVFASLSLIASSQLLVPFVADSTDSAAADAAQLHQNKQQKTIAMPPVAPPPGAANPSDPLNPVSPPPETGTTMLSDVMGRDRSINVYAGFTRDFAPISNRFNDMAQNSTVLAPLNSAIEALPRKPWENPDDYRTQGENVYEGPGGQERAQQNLRRFVEAHIVPFSPWPENYKASALAGKGELWWETTADGKRVIQPGNIEVENVASSVSNGQIWIIKGVRNYAA